jgi:hypothetical protein
MHGVPGVRRDVAADVRLLRRPRVARKEKPVVASASAQVGGSHARLHLDTPELRDERADRLEAVGGEDDASVGHGASGEPRASTSRHYRNVALVAPGERCGCLVCAPRKDDRVGPTLDPAFLGSVTKKLRGRPGEDLLSAEECRQLLLDAVIT